MESSKLLKLLLFLWPILILGCAGTDSKDPLEEETVPKGKMVDEYDQIIDQGREIDKNYKTLMVNTKEFLAKLTPENKVESKQCMMVSVIGAGAHYIAGDQKTAREMAQKAYSFSSKNSVEYLDNWRADKWMTSRPFKKASKLVKMKDFIISSNNAGFDAFKQGNSAFLGRAEYATGAENYRTALRLGLSNKDRRKECYSRLAGCLFKINQPDESKNVFLAGWAVFSNIDADVGDRETQEHLQGLLKKFAKKQF